MKAAVPKVWPCYLRQLSNLKEVGLLDFLVGYDAVKGDPP